MTMQKESGKNVAIILSGCGVFDGSEIHEAVIAILSARKAGASVKFFAPDIPQADVVNHLSGNAEPLPREVLSESARIARGKISPLSELNAKKFDAIIFPGGFGAAKNLSSFAMDGTSCSVNADVEKAIKDALSAKVALGFICISPVIAAKVIGNGVELTIGRDPSTASAINAMGARHLECGVEGFIKDAKLNVYSTPAYMLAQDILQVEAGISSMVSAMLL